MATPKAPEDVLLTLTAFSRYEESLSWTIRESTKLWGGGLLESGIITFDDTKYYEKEMGNKLLLKLLLFKTPRNPEELSQIKLKTNELEKSYSDTKQHEEPRPLNLDPGYLTPAKFVLATTKDAGHRIYLKDGIFAEVTLEYRNGAWQSFPYTYPNYRKEPYLEFLRKARKVLLEELKG